MAEEPLRVPTYADFLALEGAPDESYEWVDGAIVAMAGATRVHARLSTRLSALFDRALAGGPCVAQNADQRVWIDAHNVFLPDLSVACPPFRAPPHDPHAVCDPVAVVEILSPSTAAFDRGDKFHLYARLPSLRHYLLVAQDSWRVEHFRRQDDGTWSVRLAGPDDVLRIDGLCGADVGAAVDLVVAELYAGIEALGGPSRDTVPPVRRPGLRVVGVREG